MKPLLACLSACLLLEIIIIANYTVEWKTSITFSTDVIEAYTWNETDIGNYSVSLRQLHEEKLNTPPIYNSTVGKQMVGILLKKQKPITSTTSHSSDSKRVIGIQIPKEKLNTPPTYNSANYKVVNGMLSDEKEPKTPRNVLINSYMRSGSSFFGELLGYRPDTFYWFELFWKFTKWGFMRGSSDICDSRTCSGCTKSTRASTITSVLTAFFSCEFSKLTDVLDRDSTIHSGQLWKSRECAYIDLKPAICLSYLEKFCRNRKHTVTKILRTTLDNYSTFLKQSQDVVLIQLFRDPRAVINSRSLTGWYTFKNEGTMFEDAKCLCSRMYMDYKFGMEFQNKYPGKFMFVIYEDLLSDLNDKLNKLYEKLGMDTLGELKEINGEFKDVLSTYDVSKTKTASTRKDYEFWWRTKLSWSQVHTIDSYCGDIYKAIGYKSFKDHIQYSDSNSPSVEVLDSLKIL